MRKEENQTEQRTLRDIPPDVVEDLLKAAKKIYNGTGKGEFLFTKDKVLVWSVSTRRM